jgi:MYXO-CTERM domain-containing protein
MVGSHSDIIFADAYLKGIKNFDFNTAYESMLKNAMVFSSDGSKGRKGNERSIFMGYIPVDVLDESAAWYLEDVVNDFGISQMAKELDKQTEYEYFLNRSLNYVNLFSPSVGFFRGKKLKGSWRTPDDEFYPNEWGYEFTEGAPWHYCTAASNDPQGMANLYGGRTKLSEKIDSVFAAPRDYMVGSYGGVIHEMMEAFDTNMGQYAHANEPIHHMIYMYNYAGTPSRTQERIRDVLDEKNGVYGSGIDTGGGYLGDEDNGQMSAWYVFSAMGFYPASPGHPEYTIGSPLFTKATIHLENGSVFVVSAPANNSTNKYIQSAKLNGAVYTKNYLRHSDIVNGGSLELEMGPSPATWGSGADDVPTSITTGTRVPVPRVDKASGGSITVSSEDAMNGAGKERAFDDDSSTKWVAKGGQSFIQYQFAAGKKHTVSMYTLTSADDSPDGDPKSWTLKASNNGVDWVTLDTRTDESFLWRSYTKVYSASNTAPFAYYKFDITENHGGQNTQLAEVELIGESPVVALAATAGGSCTAEEGADKAIDGSLATKWCSQESERWLRIDLGASYDVNQFVVKHAGAGGEPASRNTKDFDIEVSTDDVEWVKVVTVRNSVASVTQYTIPPTPARYVKVDVLTPTQDSDATARIYELEVYGPPADTTGSGSSTGSGGSGGRGGSGGDGNGGSGGAGGRDDDSVEGCGCVVGSTPGGFPAFLGSAAALALLALRRRRAR